MKKARNFLEIMEYIKDLISIGRETHHFVLDKDVYKELSLNNTRGRKLKERNATPYEAIIEYCNRKGISTDEVFFERIKDVEKTNPLSSI